MNVDIPTQVGDGVQLPIGEAAKALGVSIETLRRWDKAGQIQTVRTPGGQRRFPQSEVDRIKRGEGATA